MIRMLLPLMHSLLALTFVIQLSANTDKLHDNCAVLIDRPDDLCEDMMAMTPLITCPQNVHVSCTHYTGNPSDYGQPIVNGHWQGIQIIEHPPVINTNQCGIGYVIRSWTIHTPVGVFQCTQHITITGVGSFGLHDIHWPLDYTVVGQCQENFRPEDLPPPYNRPTWNQRPCSMIGISYKDDVFYFGDPNGKAGCRKILRTWKVIDWCQYQPNHGNQGLWMRTQVIKIEDNRPPRFTNCPSDFVVGVDNNCNGTFVNFPIPMAFDNCNPNPRITNNSPFSNFKGSDASGFYPLGTTTVRFIADDACGNFDTCFVRVHVRDTKKPTPICYHGLTANLMPMGNDGFVRLNGKLFDAGSYDNCTPRSRLRFDLEPNEFTCENRGRNEVRVIVTDESGNTDFCITYVIIQDNMGMCPPDTTGGIIAGLVSFHNDEAMEDVMMYIKEDAKDPAAITDEAGIYILDKLVDGKSYSIRPTKFTPLHEGINTLDLIMLRQHISGEAPFDNPYKIIAADVNLDGKVNIHDLNQLRLIMMHNLQSFPGLKPWRFVDKSYEFEDPKNPLEEEFTEIYNIAEHNKTDKKLDFIGIKIGDFDGTCMEKPDDENGPIIYNASHSRSSQKHVLLINNVPFNAYEEIQVPIMSNSEWDLAGLQFTIKFDPTVLKLVDWNNDLNSPFRNLLFSAIDADKGLLYFSWDNEFHNYLDAHTTLGVLSFRSLSPGVLSDVIDFAPHPVQPLIFDPSFSKDHLYIYFEGEISKLSSAPQSLKVTPNPFRNSCNLSIKLPMSGDVECIVTDLSGKVVYQNRQFAPSTEYVIELQSSDLNGAGIYIVQLLSGGYQWHNKLVLID